MFCSSQSKDILGTDAKSSGSMGMISPTYQHFADPWLSRPCVVSLMEGRRKLYELTFAVSREPFGNPCEGSHIGNRRTGTINHVYCSYVAAILQLLTEVYCGGACAAFLVGGFFDFCYVGMGAQVLSQGAAEDSHAGTVDYADAGQAG